MVTDLACWKKNNSTKLLIVIDLHKFYVLQNKNSMLFEDELNRISVMLQRTNYFKNTLKVIFDANWTN